MKADVGRQSQLTGVERLPEEESEEASWPQLHPLATSRPVPQMANSSSYPDPSLSLGQGPLLPHLAKPCAMSQF